MRARRRSSDGQSTALVKRGSPVRLRPSAFDFLPLWYRTGGVLFVRKRPHMTAHGRVLFELSSQKTALTRGFLSFQRALTSEVLYQLSYVGAALDATGVASLAYSSASAANRDSP